MEGEGGELGEIRWREREGSLERLGGGRGKGARRDWVEGGEEERLGGGRGRGARRDWVEGEGWELGEIGWREREGS